MKKQIIQGLLAASLITTVFTGCSVDSVGVAVQPDRPYYARPAAPYPDYVWVDGNWVWTRNNRNYVWREGYWTVPRRNRVYVPGTWIQTRHGYQWRRGQWRR